MNVTDNVNNIKNCLKWLDNNSIGYFMLGLITINYYLRYYFVGEKFFIPKNLLILTDFSFNFKWLQFPIKVWFAITINKVRSQTFRQIGVDY